MLSRLNSRKAVKIKRMKSLGARSTRKRFPGEEILEYCKYQRKIARKILFAGLQFADPDVAEAHGIPVVLQRQRQLLGSWLVWGSYSMSGRACEFHIVLREDAIVKNRETRRARDLSRRIETRSVKNNVVRLPLARWQRSIHLRRILSIDRGSLAVRVGPILVGIENLYFVKPHQENAAVPAFLAFSVGRSGFAKFHVKLAIAECFFAVDRTGVGNNFHVAVLHFPFGRAAVLARPLGKIFSIEEDDRIGRWKTRMILRTEGSGIDYRRNGTARIVNLPVRIHLRGENRGGRRKKNRGKNGNEKFSHGASPEKYREKDRRKTGWIVTQERRRRGMRAKYFANRRERLFFADTRAYNPNEGKTRPLKLRLQRSPHHCAVPGCRDPHSPVIHKFTGGKVMSELNKNVVRRTIEELWNKGDASLADQLLAPNYTHHDSATPDVGRGPDGEKKRLAIYRTAFPDLRLTIEDLIAEGDLVMARWSARGTHRGELNGIAPTGKQFHITGVSIARISNGKMAEGWVNWDALGLMQQLGVAPEMAKSKAATR